MGGGKRVQSWEPVAAAKIRVDSQSAIAAMRNSRLRSEYFDDVFSRHAKLQLAYEDLIDGQQVSSSVTAEICDFLGVERVSMRSRLIKVNPDSLSDIVLNYDELAAAVRQTEFADQLD
jgi:hypothetical protein